MGDHYGSPRTSTYEADYWGLRTPTIKRQKGSPATVVAGRARPGAGTVTTTILSGTPGPANEPAWHGPGPPLCVRLRVWIPTPVAYVLVGGADGTAVSFHRMDEVGQGRWNLTLRLKVGTYRYRYYTADDVLGPAAEPDGAAVHLDDADAQFTLESHGLGTGCA